MAATWAARNQTYGEGADALTWTDPLAHGLVTSLSASGLAWQGQSLLDSDPEYGTDSVRPEWMDARRDGWAVTSGYMGLPVTFATPVPRTIQGEAAGGGDGFVGLIDAELALQCAYWLPGPGVERVRAVLADDGSIAVIGAVDEITLEPGTVREVTIHGAQKDGFIAYFTPPTP